MHCAYKISFPRDWGHRSHLIRNDIIQHGCILRSMNGHWHGYNCAVIIIVPCRTVTDNRATCERSISCKTSSCRCCTSNTATYTVDVPHKSIIGHMRKHILFQADAL